MADGYGQAPSRRIFKGYINIMLFPLPKFRLIYIKQSIKLYQYLFERERQCHQQSAVFVQMNFLA